MTPAQRRSASLQRISEVNHPFVGIDATLAEACHCDPVASVDKPEPPPPPIPELSPMGMLNLIELILKGRDRLERLIRESSLQPILLPKFLAIAVVGFVLFGLALALVFTS